jgi:predicted phage baseplate assembly protein
MTELSRRGRILPPDLDDRTWQDLVDEMTALIPRYAPQWTDRSPSDLGMTLIELFAAVSEGVIYRLNRVPDKNYLALLHLLGISREPATPARTYLTFTSGAGAVRVPAGTQAQTRTTERETPVIFETDDAVTVLPTALKAALLVGPYADGATSSTYRDLSRAVVGPPTADQLITVPPGRTVQLCLGFDRKVTEAIQLDLRLVHAVPEAAPVTTVWSCSVAATEPLTWVRLDGVVDSTDSLRRDGTVRLNPADHWEAQRAAGPEATRPWTTVTPATPADAVTDPLHWVGLRVTNPGADAAGPPLVARLDRLLFNSASARTALTIPTSEVLGEGTGEPFQTFELSRRPLYRVAGAARPFDHLVVEVDGQEWTLVDDLPPGPGPVFLLDPVLGEIRFGDHRSGLGPGGEGHGSVPPAGASVRAVRYRYVDSGAAGNVPHSRVTVPSSTRSGSIPAAVSVSNLGPARNGVDEQPIEETLRRAPERLTTRDRAVTAEDYELLVRSADSTMRINRCLTPRAQSADLAGTWQKGDPWTFGGILRAPGTVNVIVVPDRGPAVDRPEPGQEELRHVRAHLESRRDLTAHLTVVGPRYLPVVVKAEVTLWKAASDAGVIPAEVEAETLSAVRRFLHPTAGGPEGTGWRIGQPVLTSDLYAAIVPPDDVGYLSLLQVRPDIPLYHFPPFDPLGTATNYDPARERPIPLDPLGPSVRVADYELVCAADRHEVKAKPA